METVEELKAEIARLKRVLAPNEDPLLTKQIGAFFKNRNNDHLMAKYEVFSQEGEVSFRMEQREVAEELALPKDQRTMYLIGQSLAVLGWRRIIVTGRPYYRISAEDYEREYVQMS